MRGRQSSIPQQLRKGSRTTSLVLKYGFDLFLALQSPISSYASK